MGYVELFTPVGSVVYEWVLFTSLNRFIGEVVHMCLSFVANTLLDELVGELSESNTGL